MKVESKTARNEIREKIFGLETQLEENAEQIRNLVRTIVRYKVLFRLEIM